MPSLLIKRKTWSTNKIITIIDKWSDNLKTSQLRGFHMIFRGQGEQGFWRWYPSSWFQWLFWGLIQKYNMSDIATDLKPSLKMLARLSPDSWDSQGWWSVSLKSTSTYLFSILNSINHIGLQNKSADCYWAKLLDLEFLNRSIKFLQFVQTVVNAGRMVRWLKKSSKETMTHASICIWFWDGSKFEPFIFLLFLPRNIDHVSFGQSGSLFLARKFWSGSKFESLLPRIQFLFEFWAISKSNANAVTWHCLHRWLFEPSHNPPPVLLEYNLIGIFT